MPLWPLVARSAAPLTPQAIYSLHSGGPHSGHWHRPKKPALYRTRPASATEEGNSHCCPLCPRERDGGHIPRRSCCPGTRAASLSPYISQTPDLKLSHMRSCSETGALHILVLQNPAPQVLPIHSCLGHWIHHVCALGKPRAAVTPQALTLLILGPWLSHWHIYITHWCHYHRKGACEPTRCQGGPNCHDVCPSGKRDGQPTPQQPWHSCRYTEPWNWGSLQAPLTLTPDDHNAVGPFLEQDLSRSTSLASSLPPMGEILSSWKQSLKEGRGACPIKYVDINTRLWEIGKIKERCHHQRNTTVLH